MTTSIDWLFEALRPLTSNHEVTELHYTRHGNDDLNITHELEVVTTGKLLGLGEGLDRWVTVEVATSVVDLSLPDSTNPAEWRTVLYRRSKPTP